MQQLPILDQSEPTQPMLVDAPEVADAKGRYAFVSLGCPKNLVDSEKMLGTLAMEGYSLVSEPDGADFVIVNTCGFIDSSREESKAVIREMLDLKAAGKTKGVIVAGCLPERLGAAGLREELSDIDHVVGVFGRDEIGQVADRFVQDVGQTERPSAEEMLDEQRNVFRPAPIQALDDRARLRITANHFAYLKISEGCDRTCTFCSIPSMRGKHVTKPIEMVVAEAEELAADGTKELILVAQDTTYYGLDLYGEVRLVQLLKELEKVEGIEWIRLMYLYPIHFTDELIDTIAESSKVIPYLDMPLQHISSRVLKRMQRRVNREQTIELVSKLRERIPNLVMRTTFVVGFPGETEEEFQELKDFVYESRFERMGVFPYSLEPGTPAVKLDGHLPEEVKQQRVDELMALQQDIAFAFGDTLVEYELDVLIDEELEPGLYAGRIYADAPEIDGTVFVQGENLPLGEFVPVEILERRGYDLIGVPASEEADED
ncbi:30S ribosomal protein S12 methylthiotransferase RimO [Thalassoroseus pseudoceratinae]|uniref:30S ribosomal protein S12 methylthiotransferase RimO n=1 Tax=Thalassoroseus pseudoceratinae TaxID=2713176 RepID=UPI0014221E3F|nr:30S ribosomal protein S12 methylthiotransferase RimO [Thalassoroseus pseudoceratinae]